MADEVPQAVEEDEDAPVAEEKSGFGFQLSESIVHAIDRQIVSSGLRLILFLPGFAAFTFFFSWAFAQASPTFWEANIEPNLGLGFSTFLASLGFVVVFGLHPRRGFPSIPGQRLPRDVSRPRGGIQRRASFGSVPSRL
ncbi:MAG: hypothetical protein CM15mP78_07950 [Candidatus Poseidoniales archaeon]|nr:MAG: hypothetical protein CM15mP78_07950 [Candidatus Poseidoniales archaeon]